MRRFLLLPLFLFIGFNAVGQKDNHSAADPAKLLECGNLTDSVTLKYRNKIISEMYARVKSGLRTSKEKYKIPVVVHVIEPDKSKSLIPDAGMSQGIELLNKAYSATGEYGSSIDIGIEFELAKYDRSCNPTTGITRYDASGIDWYVNGGLPYLSTSSVFNWDDWDHQSYLNIWLISRFDIVGGVGSPEMGSVVPAKSFFWSGAAVHEIGHFQRVGVVNIQQNCTSAGTYQVTFDNPNQFVISASIGTVAGNAITNIPNDRQVILRAEADNGMTRSKAMRPSNIL